MVTPSEFQPGDAMFPVRRFRLGTEPGDDLSTSTTAEERLEMVAVLTARMWELTGREMPSYQRSGIPARLHPLK